MGNYNVIAPCVVGKLHYARPTAQPIEVDDDTAAPLVESGCLVPYRPGSFVEKIEPGTFKALANRLHNSGTEAGQEFAEQIASEAPEAAPDSPADEVSSEPEAEPEPKPRRAPRKRTEDQ